MAAKTILLPNTATKAYKTTSEALKTVEMGSNNVIKKSLVEIMKTSFFHGSFIYGGTTNFIA